MTADHHAAIAGGDALGGIEAEATGIAQQARFTAAISGFDGVSAVFDDLEMVAVGDV